MPRRPRLDAPGTLHHVMVHGIERRRIEKVTFSTDNYVSNLGVPNRADQGGKVCHENPDDLW